MKLKTSTKRAGNSLFVLTVFLGGAINAQTVQAPHPPKARSARQTYAEFVAKMNAMHKAPYERGAMPASMSKQHAQTNLLEPDEAIRSLRGKNEKVNQDRNPYAKTVGGIAIDPTDASHVIVASDDDRLGPPYYESSLGYTDDFLHISRSGNVAWSEQEGRLGASALAQTSEGVSLDRIGNGYVALDSHDDFQFNTDSSVQVQLLPKEGGSLPNAVPDSRQCVAFDDGEQCVEQLETQGIRTDNTSSANDGTTYVYYTVFCNDGLICEGGRVPGAGSVTKVASSPAFGQPFGSPTIWSGTHFNTGAASMVIDASGTPHLFFLDYTTKPAITLWESTNGVVGVAPITTFVDAGLNNPNWAFLENKVLDCGGNSSMAYCAYTSTQAGNRASHTTPSIYLAAINLVNAKTTVNRVNDDILDRGKDHFNPAVAVTHEGEVFVGWFDDRNDPANLKVDYFVGRSTDGGRTFRRQQKVNDVAFDPTIGGVGPSGALAAEGFSGVKAVWSDTRDGATQQVYSTDVFGLVGIRNF